MLVQWLATIIFLPWHACLSSPGGEILSQIENVEMKENAKFSMHEGRGSKLVFRIFYGNNFLLHFHHLMQAESWQQNHQQQHHHHYHHATSITTPPLSPHHHYHHATSITTHTHTPNLIDAKTKTIRVLASTPQIY